MAEERPYHHGDLRHALLAAAVEAIGESGVGGLSLRDLARRVGVSHAAPVHHFRDKAGLITALATEGFDRLADALDEVRGAGGDLLAIGVGYVRFALAHRAHFEVMFRRELYHADDPELRRAQQRAADSLRAGVSGLPAPIDEDDRTRIVGLAAWSIAHGFATLWLGGALPGDALGDDPEAAARRVLGHLFRVPGFG